MGPAVKIGLVAGLVALTEGLAIGRTFAKLREHRLDGNKEMMAFGFMNIYGSLFSCYVPLVIPTLLAYPSNTMLTSWTKYASSLLALEHYLVKLWSIIET